MSWYCGSHESSTVARSTPSATMIQRMLCARFACVMRTPLGSAVEPLVYCRNATADGGGRSSVPAGALLPMESVTIH